MSLTSAMGVAENCRKRCGIAATPDRIAGRIYADPAKASVMSYFGQLVTYGLGEWTAMANGDIELTLKSGATFLLGDVTIKRIT
jgi:hypothetical protein